MNPGPRNNQSAENPESSPSPESPLVGQVQHWLTHQRYPQFASVGLFNPSDYGRVQKIIYEGPEAWQREAALLKGLNYSREDFPDLPKPLLETLAAPFYTLREEISLSPWQDEIDALSFGAFLLRPFFEFMRDGLDAAIVELAEDYQGEKPSRRFGWHRETLLFAVPSSEDRMAALRRVATESGRPPLFRQRAVRWVPPTLPASAELQSFLESFDEERDPLVKYWAAAHLVRSRREDTPLPEWIYPALWHGLGEDVGPGMGCYEDERTLSARTASLLDELGEGALLRSLTFLESSELINAESCREILLRLFLRHYHEEHPFTTLRERWKAEMKPESQRALVRLRRQQRAVQAAAFELHPKLNYGVPEGVTYGLNLDHCIRADLKDALSSPRLWMCRLPQRLEDEFQRQQEHANADPEAWRVDEGRLARARLHLQDLEKLDGNEMAEFARELSGAILSATAEFLAQERVELSPRRFFQLEGYWNKHW